MNKHFLSKKQSLINIFKITGSSISKIIIWLLKNDMGDNEFVISDKDLAKKNHLSLNTTRLVLKKLVKSKLILNTSDIIMVSPKLFYFGNDKNFNSTVSNFKYLRKHLIDFKGNHSLMNKVRYSILTRHLTKMNEIKKSKKKINKVGRILKIIPPRQCINGSYFIDIKMSIPEKCWVELFGTYKRLSNKRYWLEKQRVTKHPVHVYGRYNYEYHNINAITIDSKVK